MNSEARAVRFTSHAKQRCREMRVPEQVATWITENADMVRPAMNGRLMAVSDKASDYQVVYADSPEERTIITILFNTKEQYLRLGYDYMPTPQAA